MSPSIAKLASQEEAATAFAEVRSLMEFLVARRGLGVLREIVDGVRAAANPEDVVAKAGGFSKFGDLEGAWRESLLVDAGPPRPVVTRKSLTERLRKRQFRGGARSTEEEGTGKEPMDERAVRHLRLGEILRARGRTRAAVVEYERAYVRVRLKPGHMSLARKLGLALLDLGEWTRAEELLRTTLSETSEDPAVLSALGRCALEQGAWEQATLLFEETIRLNPFVAEPHVALARLYRKLGQPGLALREERVAIRLQ